MALQTIPGRAIELGSDAAGDLAYYDGSKWTRLAKGTATQQLAVNAGATAPEWVTPGVVQMKYDSSTAQHAVASDTTNDSYQTDVLPTISFGSQFMSVAITPKSASNILVVEHLGMYHDYAMRVMVALFSGNTCVGVMTHDVNQNDYIQEINATATFVAGTTSALTITARASGAGQLTFNGKWLLGTTSRKYNTAQKSSLIVTEYRP